jgi:hypothetical protein
VFFAAMDARLRGHDALQRCLPDLPDFARKICENKDK